MSIVFHSGSNCEYHFMVKELAEEFKKQSPCLGKNTKKYITFAVPKEKRLQELIYMENKLQKIYLTYFSLLIAQNLWQAHYQILLIIYLKDFIELNVN